MENTQDYQDYQDYRAEILGIVRSNASPGNYEKQTGRLP